MNRDMMKKITSVMALLLIPQLTVAPALSMTAPSPTESIPSQSPELSKPEPQLTPQKPKIPQEVETPQKVKPPGKTETKQKIKENDRIKTSKEERVREIRETSKTNQLQSSSTSEPPTIYINSCQELQDIQRDLDGNYHLENDINCSETKSWNDGKGFKPIGTFTGSFDGQGNVITGLYIDRGVTKTVGLFRVSNGVIKNVGLENVDINGGSPTGSLVGRNKGKGIVFNSYTAGNSVIKGYENTGGLVGSNAHIVSNSYASSSVDTGDDGAGGLVGYNGNSGSISDSYATGSVSALNLAGGLVGHNNGGSVSNSYATGHTTGRWDIGGLIGYSDSVSCSDSFWDVNTTGQDTSDGCDQGGRTTSEMQDKSTFTNAGWNFTDTWYMKSYPALQWNYRLGIQITSPKQGATLNHTTVTMEYSSNTANLDHYEVKKDGYGWIDVGTQETWGFGLSEGNWTLYAKAVSKLREQNQTSIDIEIDTTPPELSINNPQNNELINKDSILLNYSSTSNDIDHYKVRIDEGTWINNGQNTDYKFTNLTEGTHLLEVKAIDDAGHQEKENVSATIDTVPANIHITSPQDDSELNKTTVTMNYTSNATDIDHYEVKLSTGNWINTGLNESYTFENLAEDTYTLYTKSIDQAGNEDEDTVTIEVDTTSPTVNIHDPQDGEVINKDHVLLNYSSPSADIAQYKTKLDAGNWNDNGLNTTYSFTDLTDNNHVLKVKAIDESGNSETADVFITVDTKVPTINITSPDQGALLNSSSVTMEYQSNEEDLDHYEVKKDNKSWINNNLSTSYTFTLSDGTHTLQAKVLDDDGNQNNGSIAVEIDTTTPQFMGFGQTVTNDSAAMSVNLNEEVTAKLLYGKTTNYGNTLNHTYYNDSHVFNITGLEPDTTYHYKVEATDRAGNTGESQDNNFTTEKSPDNTAPQFTFIPQDQSITYGDDWTGAEFNATDTDSSIDSWSINNTQYFTINQTGYLDDKPTLPAGTYKVEVSVNDTAGNTNSTTYTLTVDKAASNLSLNAQPSWTETQGTQTNISGTNCPSQLTCRLYRDGAQVPNPDIQNLSTGTYLYEYQTSGNENYTSDTVNNTLTITSKSTPSLSLNVDNATYPEDGTINASESNTEDDDLIYNLYIDGNQETTGSNIDITRDLGAGNYTVEYNTTGGENYSSNSVTKTLEITKGNPNLGISGTSPITYGTKTNVTGSNCPSQLICTLNPSNDYYGAGNKTFNYSTDGNENYTSDSAVMNIEIQPKDLDITADDKSKTYGASDPSFTASYTGFVLNDSESDLSGNLSYTRESGQGVGTYNIEPSGHSSENYSINYLNGTLTINKRNIEITADDKSKTYGETDPSLTHAITNGSLAYSDNITGSLSRESGEAAGNYTIQQGNLSIENITNYNLTFITGTLRITKATSSINITFTGNGTAVTNQNYTILENQTLNVTTNTNVPPEQVKDTLFHLYEDGEEVGTQTGNEITYTNSTLEPGNYTFKTVFNESENYTQATRTHKATVKSTEGNETNQAPNAEFTANPQIVKVGESVTLNASESSDPDGDSLTYTWNLSDGIIDTGETTNHSYSSKGLYTMTLTVEDSENESDTVQETIAVYEENATQPDIAVNSESITFNNTSPTEGEEVQVTAEIYNLVNTTLNNFTVIMKADSEEFKETIVDFQGTRNLTTTGTWTAKQGTHQIKIQTDSNNDITESNETNNNASKQINVSEAEYKNILENTTIESNYTDYLITDNPITQGNTTVKNYSTVRHSELNKSTIIDSTILKSTILNSTVIDTYLEDIYLEDSYIDPSNITNSTFTNSNITDSTILHSTIENSTIKQSTIKRSTITNSTILNSTVLNSTVINANITNNMLCSGVVWYQGDKYNGSGTCINISEVYNNTQPTANFTASSTNVNPGDTITFDGTLSYDTNGNLTSYEWNLGDGTAAAGDTTTYSYGSAGTYTVTLTVKDDTGATDQYNMNISVTTEGDQGGGTGGGGGAGGGSSPINNPPTADAGENIEIAVDEQTTLQGTGTDADGEIVKYRWDFTGDGEWDYESSETGQATHTYTETGSYTAKLQVQDNQGKLDTDTVQITVTEKEQPPQRPQSTEEQISLETNISTTIDYTYNGETNKTTGRFTIGPLQETGNYSIIINIPKQVARNITHIQLVPEPDKVLEQDPTARWNTTLTPEESKIIILTKKGHVPSEAFEDVKIAVKKIEKQPTPPTATALIVGTLAEPAVGLTILIVIILLALAVMKREEVKIRAIEVRGRVSESGLKAREKAGNLVGKIKNKIKSSNGTQIEDEFQ